MSETVPRAMKLPELLLGKYVRFDYPDKMGGAGRVVKVTLPNPWSSGLPLAIADVDWGYGFEVYPDTMLTVLDQEPER